MRAADQPGVDALLDAARARLDRVGPLRALRVRRAGGLLVDIRPEVNRRTEGVIPFAVVVERNVVEWRLDPRGTHRLDGVRADRPVVVVCDEGYASSLAAAVLLDLGLTRATDLIGGFRAWRASGLPVAAEPGEVTGGRDPHRIRTIPPTPGAVSP